MRIICTTVFILITINLNGQGLIFDPEEYENTPGIERTRADQFTEQLSLKTYTPYTMRQTGSSCVAYSLASARTMIYAMHNGLIDKEKISTNYISPHWIYYHNKMGYDDSCMGGLIPDRVLKFAQRNGLARMMHVEHPDYYPFTNDSLCNEYPPELEFDQKDAMDWGIDEYYRLSTTEEIKIALSRGDPVMLGMRITSSFENSYDKELWIPDPVNDKANSMGHAMLIIGYDENYEGGAFEILNSWGSEWGKDGYIWILESDLMDYKMGLWAIHCYQQFGLPIKKEKQIVVLDSISQIDQIKNPEGSSSLNELKRLGMLMDQVKKKN